MPRAVSPDQLLLPLEPVASPRLPARVDLPQPGLGDAPFDDEGWFFEPWWPGEPAAMLVEDGRPRLVHRGLADAMRAFPELAALPDQLSADGVTLVGTLLVLDRAGRPDRELLRSRLAGAAGVAGSGAFVASDLLYAEGRSLAAWPFAQRRARLLGTLADSDRCVANRGLRGEGLTLAEAAASMGLDAIAARRLSARWHPGTAAADWLRLPVLVPPAAETRPLLVLLQRLPLGD